MKGTILFFFSLIVSTAVFAQHEKINEKPINFTPTLYDANGPLFVVDDLVYSKKDSIENRKRIADLDPNTIESIMVHKGKSAIDLFGEDGKNGVVVITTKEFGKKSKVQQE